MKNVIVSGASGFIGKWLTKELIDNDISVVALVRNKNKVQIQKGLCIVEVNDSSEIYGGGEYSGS